ncbi:hypothetical protein F5876DRAFT_64610 [Lentinula aff. lateritia]|uniref:Uncharacterized protein n=1 Tax=Lentinula aff. lateritia TaxID=2804960 RepID=A0ACC1U4I7_9AGAR|nr:hypothetical protein F5876DRAFT_64610 [Lentinula aff. lateritia]
MYQWKDWYRRRLNKVSFVMAYVVSSTHTVNAQAPTYVLSLLIRTSWNLPVGARVNKEGEDPAVPISQTASLSTGPSCSHKENFLSKLQLPDQLYATSRDHEANGLSSSRTSNRIFPTGSSLQSLVPKISASTPTTESDDIVINSKGSVDYPPDVGERESALVVEVCSSILILLGLLSISYAAALPHVESPVQSRPSPLVVNGDGMPSSLKAVVFYKRRSYPWRGVIPELVKSSPLLRQIHNLIERDIKADEAVQAYNYQVQVFCSSYDQPPKFENHKFDFSVRYYVDTVKRKDFPGRKNGTFTFIPNWEYDQPTLPNDKLDSTWQYIKHLYTATEASNSTKKSLNPAAQSFDPSKQPAAPYDLKIEWH